jgi:hypothetical protein
MLMRISDTIAPDFPYSVTSRTDSHLSPLLIDIRGVMSGTNVLASSASF